LVAFGDTFGRGWTGTGTGSGGGGGDPAVIDWRSNTLARSSDRNPADGMSFNDFVTDRPGHAKELLPSLKQDGVEMTKIPTGGVNVGGRNYLAYMSVRSFTQPGHWDHQPQRHRLLRRRWTDLGRLPQCMSAQHPGLR
jgi:hypothetical protein